uniref:Uncharacterized protein n=1 Tax=Rhizophora mucronata TaxID=61149 RepID=A0A2P2N6J5_RHIMU
MCQNSNVSAKTNFTSSAAKLLALHAYFHASAVCHGYSISCVCE